MIYYDVDQGSIDWQLLRLGIPTGSSFEKIITPTGRPSKQVGGLIHHLVAESLMGSPIEQPTTSWMERGTELEGDAVCYYEFQRDVAAPKIGFITNDEGTVGVSPDRIIGNDGMLEIKCPAPQTHVGYMIDEDVDEAYRAQLQGQLWIAEREWVDICSYHPWLPAVIVRVERDDEYIGKLAVAVAEFIEQLEAAKAQLRAKGHEFKDNRRIEVMERTRRNGVSSR